jgi:hypothetical protein
MTTKLKHCFNCKNFIIKKSEDIALGRCRLFEYDNINQYSDDYIKYLITGEEHDKPKMYNDYYLALRSRGFDHLCGEKGNLYDEKNK